MRHLFAALKKHRLECVLAPLFKMLEAFFDLQVPIFVARLIDEGIGGASRETIWRYCLLLIGMAALGLICSFTAQYFAARAASASAVRLRRDLYRKVLEMNYQRLDESGVSTLITRLTSDVNLVQNGVNMFLRLFLRSPFIVFGSVIMAFTVSAKAALVFLVCVPVLAVIIALIMKRTSPLYRTVQEKLDGVTRLTRENLSGVRVVRAFRREQDEEKAFASSNEALYNASMHAARISARMNPLTYVVINLGIAAILIIASRLIDGGSMLSGDVVALINYMGQILVELVKLANLVVLLSRAYAGVRRISDVLDADTRIPIQEITEAEDAETAIAFDRVSLRYQGAGEDSLTDISFTVKAGETVGVIGGTGSGKTSLVNLIPRLYDATEGAVRVFGRDVKSLDSALLRRTIAVVPQKSQLFLGTVRSNLTMGRENAPDDLLWQALEDAQAADFVRAKDGGLDAAVEQGGRNFSGGQKQRLTIARALVTRAPLLILDDASSALDMATDARLRAALKRMTDVTKVIVSQRTASLTGCDRILVLDDGRLAACGTHEELLEISPIYREIHESQHRKGEEM